MRFPKKSTKLSQITRFCEFADHIQPVHPHFSKNIAYLLLKTAEKLSAINLVKKKRPQRIAYLGDINKLPERVNKVYKRKRKGKQFRVDYEGNVEEYLIRIVSYYPNSLK